MVAESDDFNTIDAFRLLDKVGKGEIEFGTLLDSLHNEVSRYAPQGLKLNFTD